MPAPSNNSSSSKASSASHEAPSAVSPKPSNKMSNNSSSSSSAAASASAARRGSGAIAAATLTESILQSINQIYTGSNDGLVAIGRTLRESVIPPRKRACVLVLGNHSAGKSSFVNYYTGEEALSSGVAVESRGFAIVSAGSARQNIKGKAALVDNEHVKAVIDTMDKPSQATVLEHLCKHVITSKIRETANVEFIDTPGLIDGFCHYPFDVNDIICKLGDSADLILVFLDPIGQALCARTMKVVRHMEYDQGLSSKMHYYLTKADTVPIKGGGLTKVAVQIATDLSPHIKNTHGFGIQHIWIPQEDTDQSRALPEMNDLGKLLTVISDSVNDKVQGNINKARDDCDRLLEKLEVTLARQRKNVADRRTWLFYQILLFPWLLVLGSLSFFDVLVSIESKLPASMTKAPFMQSLYGFVKPTLLAYAHGLQSLDIGFDTLQQRLLAVSVSFFVASLLLQFFKCRRRGLKTLEPKDIDALRLHRVRLAAIKEEVSALEKANVRAVAAPDFHPSSSQ